MPARKYQTLDANGNTTMEASVVTSAGAGDEGKIVALGPDGKISRTMDPSTPAQGFVTTELMAANAFANLWTSTGSKVRNADASGGITKKADGVTVAGAASAATAIVDLDNVILVGLSGLTPDATYFLSATVPGGIAKVGDAGFPTTAGHILQKVGKAIDATSLKVDIGDPIILA